MQTFRRTPVSELPRSLYIRHMLVIVIIGAVLIAGALALSLNLKVATEARAAQQDARAVQMAIRIVGEEQIGLGRKESELFDENTGELSEDFAEEVRELSGKAGDVRLYVLEAEGTEAPRMSYDTGGYRVEFDETSEHMWTVACNALPWVVIEY